MKKKAIIGLMLLLLGVAFYFVFIRYQEAFKIESDSYIFTSHKVIDNLFITDMTTKDTMIDYTYAEENEIVYKQGNKYFLGDTEKKEILVSYPMISKDGTRVSNLGDDKILITEDFKRIKTYDNAILTDGSLYNATSMEQADEENYFLLNVDEKVFLNSTKIYVTVKGEEKFVPLNSIVYFMENEIRYFYLKDDSFLYGRISGIDSNDEVRYFENTISYRDLLLNLELIVEHEEDDDYYEEEIIPPIKNEDFVIPDIEYVYIKPEVTTEIISVGVYSFQVNVSIMDNARRIETSPTYEIIQNGKTFLRKTLYSTGSFDISGLLPNTEFQVVAYFTYRNEHDKLIKKTILETTIVTKDISQLEPIKLTYKNDTFYQNQIEFKDMKLMNNKTDEVLKGIKEMQVIINGEVYLVSNAVVQKLKKLQQTEYITPPSLDSNTLYDVQFIIKDLAGNELKVDNAFTTSKTTKAKPTASISIISTDLTYFDASVDISNPDDVLLDNLIYVVTDSENNIIKQGELINSSIQIGDLDINSVYNVSVFADYDLDDGKGLQTNVLLKQVKVTTKPLSTLGFVRFNLKENELTQHEAKFDLSINLTSTDKKLLELLDTVHFIVKVKETDEIVREVTVSSEDVAKLKNSEETHLLEFLGLYSNTFYKIEITTDIKQGSKIYTIKGLSNITEFSTLKMPATVDIVNQFSNESLIDFDVKITDIDGAIESDRVLLYMRDSSGTLVSYKIFKQNQDYERLTFDKLEKDEKYTFTFIAEQYNLGYTNATYEQDKELLKHEIVTNEGIYGSIRLDSLLKEITSENLFDVSNNKRWKKEGNSTINSKIIDANENIITLAAKNGYGTYSYYLPEAKLSSITVSFYARHTKESNMQDVYLSNGGSTARQEKLEGISTVWKYYEYTFVLKSNSYLGFYINEISNNNTITEIQIKDMMVYKTQFNNQVVRDISDSYHSSNYIFTNTSMISGDKQMPNYNNNNTMEGNVGNGYARITRLSDNTKYNFSYTGSEQVFTVPTTGDYKIELWGASGHGDKGRGAYTKGEITLNASTKLYIYVGQKGSYQTRFNATSFNGGGSGSNTCNEFKNYLGGGATDVRLKNGDWDNLDGLKSRIMVAAGGGAQGWGSTAGGDGGELVGLNGSSTLANVYGRGASQVQGGLSNGSFGKGGNAVSDSACASSEAGGGGGGYYGGGGAIDTGTKYGAAGGGGSSYISGHEGCIAIHKQKTIATKKYLKYTEKETLKGEFLVDIVDSKQELEDQHFYVEIYENDRLTETYQYEMDEPYLVFNRLVDYHFKKNKSYSVVLNIKMRDRLYPISTAYFTTDEEIRTIKTVDDFFNMHVTGKYLVAADLDFRDTNRSYPSIWFSGKVDFQGHKMLLDVQGAPSRLFQYVASDAVFSNMDIHYYLNNPEPRGSYWGLFEQFRGRMTNIKMTVEESTDVPNVEFCLIAYNNSGLVENFVIHNKAGLSGQRWTTLGNLHNYGTMRNGYIYGANINASYPTTNPQQSKRVGAIGGYAASNSRIENVYSLIGIDGVHKNNTENYNIDSRIGSLVGEHNRGIISNVYSYTSGNNRDLTFDANVGNYGSVTAKNMYYVADQIYNSVFSLKVAKLALRDEEFQKIINEDDMFNIEDFVKYGYYPQLKWPDSMPNQDYLSLPTIDDADLIDITNVKETRLEGNRTIAVLLVNNPSNEVITNVGIKDVTKVEILDQKTEGGKTTLTVELIDPINYVSKYYVKSISARSAYGREYSRSYEDNERVLFIDMYREINSVQDWLLINTYPNENFILNTDLDFKDMPTNKFQITNAKGIINGNGHTIKNAEITVNDGIIRNLYGKFINFNVENIKRTRDNVNDRFGVIGYAYNSSVIDNVHVKDIVVHASNRMGGIAGYANGLILRNSSVTNITTQSLSGLVDIKVGGLIGEGANLAVDNCYAQNVDFNVTSAKVVHSVGGLIGYASSGDIANVYATGIIETHSQKVGGLIGQSNVYIRNSYSNIDITTKSDFAGGIAGNGDTNIANCFSVGSIYSYIQSNYVKRILGNSIIENNNYAWDSQHINGKISGETSGETLLTTEQLADPQTYTEMINFTDDFDYTDLSNKKLPKLKYTDGRGLLPNQEDNVLASYMFEVVSIETVKSISNITVQVNIENPEGYEITDVKVDDMIGDITKNINHDGLTTIEMLLTPEKAFDSYKLSKLIYKDDAGNSKTYNTDIKLDAQFYKDLEKYEDWQKISTEYAENYRLIADIDFAGKSNVNYNVLFNRLEGTGDTKKVIKNININVSGSDQSLINNVISNINNVEFNNITIKNTSTGNVSRNGLILYAHGYFSNIHFQDITLDTAKSNYVGLVSFERTTDLRDVTLDKINVKGREYTAGFIARGDSKGITNINASNVTVNATGNYVGGVFGNINHYWTTVVFHISGKNMNINSTGNYVGGIGGYGAGSYIDITDSHVVGNSYVGGVSGQHHAGTGSHIITKNTIVEGKASTIGGIAGHSYNLQYVYVVDSEIRGINTSSNNVGGLVGQRGYTIYNSGIQNSIVESKGSYVGGLTGKLSYASVTDSYVYNTSVTGENYVGGVVGIHEGVSNTIQKCISNASVVARSSGAGGLLGYAVNSNTDSASNRIYLYHNIVSGLVVAGSTAGGLVGRMDKLPYDGHMYSNVVIANVTTTNVGAKPSLVIGSSDYFSYNINNLKVYNGSVLNGQAIGTEVPGIESSVYVTANQLATQTTYTNIGIGTGNFNFNKLSSGYLPYNKTLKEGYYVYFPLPTATFAIDAFAAYPKAQMMIEEEKIHVLPNVDVYASDINAVNIEFKEEDPLTTLSVNGTNVAVNHKVYTINYDFKNDLVIKLSDGLNEITKTYKAEDLKNRLYVEDNKYYILKDDKIVTNNGQFTHKVIHIYENKALLSDGSVYNLDTKSLIGKQDNNIYIRDIAKPLFVFDYEDAVVNTYYNFSTIAGEEVKNQVFVKNGRLEMINGGTGSYKNSIIVDAYNNVSYLTMLSKEGYIYNLKDKIKFPSNFDNAKIKYMSNNLTASTYLVAVMYENGGAMVFDYRTGSIHYREYKNSSNLLDYYVEKIAYKSSTKAESSISSSYNESKKLITKLEKQSIEEVKADKTIENNNSYISVYNDYTKKYEVYEVSDVVKKNKVNSEKLNNSVTDQINDDPNLINHYAINKEEKETYKASIYETIIFSGILIGILISAILLGKNVMKKAA